jgi:glycosyltransferase involved in cell wall biosynthesis
MKPMISIIVPVHGELNDPSYLLALMKDVIDFQGEIELIIAFDETGTQNSKNNFEIISMVRQSNIIIDRSSFGSPGNARNFGLKKAKGEWITFCDADDALSIKEFNNMIRTGIELDKDTCVGSYISHNLKNGNLKKFKIDPVNWKLNYKTIANSPGIWRFAFKRSSIADVKFPNLSMGEDQVFLVEYFSTMRSILFYEPIVYTYHVGFSGQLTSYKSNQKKISKALKLSIVQLMRTTNPESLYLLTQMITNQALTSLKYGGPRQKLFGAHVIIKLKMQKYTSVFKRKFKKDEE